MRRAMYGEVSARYDVIQTTSLSTNALSFVTSCFLANIRLTADQRLSYTARQAITMPFADDLTFTTCFTFHQKTKNSSGDEIANVNF